MKRITTSFLFAVLVIIGLSFPVLAEEGHDHSAHKKKPEKHDDHEGHDHSTHKEKPEKHDDHEDHDEENVMQLDSESREMIGMQTARVQKRTFGDRLKVYGRIAKDTERYRDITFDEKGIVEDIHVELGQIVDEGTLLLTLKKLDGAIENIKSPEHGTVISIYVNNGEKVDHLTSLLSIVNVDILRASIDIYEKDLRFVKNGQPVEVVSIAYPEKVFNGKVVFISPEIDEQSNSVKARVDVDNSEHLLKLGMSISGELIYHTDRESLIVPKSAVQLVNGENVVFVPEGNDQIRIKEIVLGHALNDVVEIKSGVSDGEYVVTQGSFYLKSEREKESFGDGHAH